MSEAEDIVRSIRDQTTDICIRAIESLYLDSQGLILDADTLDACVSMLRSLKGARQALAVNKGGEARE